MKFRILIFGALMMALFSGCCSSCRAYQKLQQPLQGTLWQLVQLEGQAVEAQGEDFTLLFDAEGHLAGRGACNRLMASYRSDSSRSLHLDGLATTRMMCSDPREATFLEALHSVTHYEMDGPMLMLLSNGSLVALFEARGAQQ